MIAELDASGISLWLEDILNDLKHILDLERLFFEEEPTIVNLAKVDQVVDEGHQEVEQAHDQLAVLECLQDFGGWVRHHLKVSDHLLDKKHHATDRCTHFV